MNEFAKPNLAVSQIPSSSVADAGKALVVGEDGVPIWGSGGGGSGGGVEVVYLTLMSNNDKGYIIHNNFPYVNENEETIMPTPTDGDVFPGWPVVMGFPKFGDGAVLILLDSLIDSATVDYSVTPVITGGVELIQGGLKLTGDGTIAFNGTLDE
jgi:hypothetical protein